MSEKISLDSSGKDELNFSTISSPALRRSLWRLSQRAATMIRRLRPANWC